MEGRLRVAGIFGRFTVVGRLRVGLGLVEGLVKLHLLFLKSAVYG